MAHRKKYRQVIQLRLQGLSYSQIKEIIKVSKSTLSLWLGEIELNEAQFAKLKIRERKIENFRKTMQKKRSRRIHETYLEACNILPLSQRELFIAGLFLYWGEGKKNLKGQINLTNTDPSMMQFYLFWLTKICKISKKKLRVCLHLYQDMNIQNEIKYWSNSLKIPQSQFIRPYIKPTLLNQIHHEGFKHGTCSLYFSEVLLIEKILMSIKAISNNYNNV